MLGGRGVFTDGSRTVEVIDIGAGPHADEMLVVWLPQEKFLFQGDLMNRDGRGNLQPANDTTVHFAEWLKKSALPVEKLVGSASTARSAPWPNCKPPCTCATRPAPPALPSPAHQRRHRAGPSSV